MSLNRESSCFFENFWSKTFFSLKFGDFSLNLYFSWSYNQDQTKLLQKCFINECCWVLCAMFFFVFFTFFKFFHFPTRVLYSNFQLNLAWYTYKQNVNFYHLFFIIYTRDSSNLFFLNSVNILKFSQKTRKPMCAPLSIFHL